MEVIINGQRFIPATSRAQGEKSFNELVKEARKAKQESLAEAAKNLKMSKSTLWEFEDGRMQPSLKSLQKLITYYNIDFYDINPIETLE